jgi:hypothetical protein
VTTSKSRQIKIFTPTGKVVTLEVTTETSTCWVRDKLREYENIKHWHMNLIWKGDVLVADKDLSKVLLETTTGAAVLHLIGGTQIFVTGPGPRNFVLNVEDDDTIFDVARQVQAILGGSGYLLTKFGGYLDAKKTVAYYQLKSYDWLGCEEYDPIPAWIPIPSICSASSAIGGTLAGTRVEECASADGDEQRDDEQIKIHTPTGNNFMVFATETRKENDHRSKNVIWKVHMTTGPPHTEPLDDTAGTLMMQMMNGIDKDMLGVRTLMIIVKADDTIQDVIKQIQAMLGGGLDYLLTHCEKLLSETTTVADCHIKPYDVLVFTECLITEAYW